MKQTSGFISTYSADTFGVCSALFELGGMVVMHDASGCNSTYTTHDEPRWYDTDSMVYISGLTEIEAIMGDDGKIISDICEAANELHPEFIAIAGTPIPAMTGFDADAAAAEIRMNTGIPSFGFKTTGMKSYVHGAAEAFLMLADNFTERDIKRTQNPSANILGLTPLDFSVNTTADSIRDHVRNMGYEIISSWAMGSTLSQIKKAGAAHVNFVVSETGIPAAKKLNELYGTPFKVGLPVGGYDIDLNNLYNGCENVQNNIAGAEVLVIGESVGSKSLAKYLKEKYGKRAVALTATDTDEESIEDAIRSCTDLKTVIADPLFKPVCKNIREFIPLPHEAFSGRLFRKDIPDIVKNGFMCF